MIKHHDQGHLQMEGFVPCSSGKEKYKTIISGEHGSKSAVLVLKQQLIHKEEAERALEMMRDFWNFQTLA